MIYNYYVGTTGNRTGVKIPELLNDDETSAKNLYVDANHTKIFLKPCLYEYTSGGTTRHALLGLSNTQTVYRLTTGSQYDTTLTNSINGGYYADFEKNPSGYTLPCLSPNSLLRNIPYQENATLPIFANESDLLAYCVGDPIPQYTWSSVPSISGKNGILTLSTLNDINDGEEVTTSDTTKFTLASASNVGKLIEDIVNE